MTNNKHISILTTNALGFNFLVKHKAIKFENEDNLPLILHRTTSGVEIITYNKFIQDRHIFKEKKYTITQDFDPYQIQSYYNNKPFNWITNNCEDFVADVIRDVTDNTIKPRSPQRTFWITLTAIILIAMIIVKYEKA